ncbi:MAG: PEP-CTERM sorting domain-containing protein [Phycisphaeraceae bacterium]
MQNDLWAVNSAVNLTLTPQSDSLIEVGSDASFAGALNVDVSTDTVLYAGDTFTLIDIAGTRTGTFENHGESSLLGTFDGVNLYLTYAGGDGNDVVAYAAIPGDIDADGDIDDTDLGSAYANYTGPEGGGMTFVQGDTDGDGDVDDTDLGTAFVNYTGPFSPGVGPSAGIAVPEPASAALLALGAWLFGPRRRGGLAGQVRASL